MKASTRNTIENWKAWLMLRSVSFYIWVGSIGLFFLVYLLATLIDFAIHGTWGFGSGHLEHDAAYHTVQALSRSLGQALGIALTCLAIALPVTANLYTPRLIKLFMTDRFNLVMLGLITLAMSHNVWGYYALRHTGSMEFELYVTLVLFFLSFTLMISYFRHMAKYFTPSFLLVRMEQDIMKTLRRIQTTREYRNAMRIHILINLDNIGNMVLKSIYRSDREVALAGIHVFRRLFDEYTDLKSEMPDAWMELDYSRFPGMSTEGLTEVNSRKIWFELLILRYMARAFSSSLNLMQDLVSEVAAQNQHVGLMALLKEDQEVVSLCIRSFNTYLTHAIEQRDTLSVHNVLYQYINFAEMLISFDPVLLRNVTRHIRFHTVRSARRKMANVVDTSIYELIQLAYSVKAARQDDIYDYICDTIISIDISFSPREAEALIRAKLVFAAMLGELEDAIHLHLIHPQLESIPRERLAHLYDELLIKNEKIQSEVTDRFISLSYLRPGQHAALKSIFRDLGYERVEDAQ